jgi:hypothetical protein
MCGGDGAGAAVNQMFSVRRYLNPLVWLGGNIIIENYTVDGGLVKITPLGYWPFGKIG